MSAAPIVGDASAAWDPSVFHSAVVPGEVTPRHWLVAVVTILAYCLIELVLPALVSTIDGSSVSGIRAPELPVPMAVRIAVTSRHAADSSAVSRIAADTGSMIHASNAE